MNSFKVAQEQGLDDTFEAYYKHIMAVGDVKVEPKERERVAELQESIDRYMEESQGGVLYSKTEEDDFAKIDRERLEFERKDINPELKGREDEKVKAVKINRFFTDKKSSKDISIDDVIARIDEIVETNEKGVRVLKNSVTGETATLSNVAISKMFNSTRSRKDGNIGGILGKESIVNIKDIFNSALLIKTHNDEKHRTKNNIRRYANVIESDGESFIVKLTIKEMSNNRNELTDMEIEENNGRDLSAYDLKVGRKNTVVDALDNLVRDKSQTSNGNGFTINDLIDFVNTYTDKTIKINGVNRPTQNSAGNRIARTEEGLRLFYKWFGDSKVVDEQGRPLVVYHGTNADFDAFNLGKNGYFFTPDLNNAQIYANEAQFEKGGKKIVMPVYLNTKKTKELYSYDELRNIDVPSLKKQGYDGAYYKSETQPIYVAFNPNQIKSIDNRGSFDENNKNIYYSQTEGDILGSYDIAKREVELFKGHNPSTLTHELGHHFIISHLNFMESIGANDKNKPVFEFLSGLANREINSVRDMKRADHENLVEAFIDYMNIGQAPNIVTGNIFQRAKMVLKFVRSGVEMVGFFIKKGY